MDEGDNILVLPGCGSCVVMARMAASFRELEERARRVEAVLNDPVALMARLRRLVDAREMSES